MLNYSIIPDSLSDDLKKHTLVIEFEITGEHTCQKVSGC